MNKRVIAGAAIAALLVAAGACFWADGDVSERTAVTAAAPLDSPLAVPAVTVTPSLSAAITASPTVESPPVPMASERISAVRPAQTGSVSGRPTAKPVAKASAKPAEKPTVKPTAKPVAGTKPAVTPKPTVGLFCTLDILGSRVQVYNSVAERSLEKRPGWLTSSAMPGSEGVCVIYGHRNRRHLRALENIEVGDEIAVTTADGDKYVYKVFETQICESTDELRLPAYDERMLVLVTCYPFRYSGSAPGKFLCVCRIIN